MNRCARVLAGVGLFFMLVATAGPLVAQPPAKKVLTFADSDIWRNSSAPVLSPDGVYAAFSNTPNEGEGEAIVRHIASGKEYKFPRGSGFAVGGARFTPDGKRVLIPLNPTKAEIDKAKSDKVKTEDMPQTSLAVVELATGAILDRFPASGSFLAGGEGAGFVVYRKPTQSGGDGKGTAPGGGGSFPGKFPFPGKGGGAPPTSPEGGGGSALGTELLVRDVGTKSERGFPWVSQFSLSKDSKLLVYVVNAKNEELNGVYAIDPRSGGSPSRIKVGPGKYSNITWDEKQTKLAFLYDDSNVIPPNQAPMPRVKGAPSGGTLPTTPSAPVAAKWHVFVWDRNGKPATAITTKLPTTGGVSGWASLVTVALMGESPAVAAADEVLGPTTPGQRTGWSLSGGSVAFSPDGSRIYVNTAPKREAPPSSVGPPRPDDFQLDLWHWKDERLQPMQKLQAGQDQAKTYSGVVLLDKKEFRQLSDETITVGQTQLGTDWAVGSDDAKYRPTTGYGQPYRDFTAVNVRTGEKKSLMGGYGGYGNPPFLPSTSPTGKHILGFDGKDWFSVSIPDGKKTNLTANLKVNFFDELDDHPHAPPPAGAPQWTADGNFVLVNDRYDLWKLAADGSSAENLTKIGRAQQIRFTILNVRSPDDTEVVRGFDLTKPYLLRAENLHTRDSGFYRLEPGVSEPKLLIMGPRRYGFPTKAKNADVYLLSVETFYDHPDFFAADANFHELKRVTDTNPKIREYNWGKAELVHFKSSDGVPLSGVLVKPENFDPSKKYPMIVYIYERESQTVHNFHLPSVSRGQIINPTFYASNGYLVWMPDIAYKTGLPGQSAIKCVLPGIQAVVDKGFVDEKAIGINGQSWGGYQIAYMVTQTDRFKAAVAGAPVSNMTSAYGGIRWGSGLTRQFQYEWTQSRIGATLWEAPMKYLENSPVFMADRVKTPLLMIHNDQDDAVPWYQGIEYYLALRRLGKECYLLNYNGEPHNLAKRAAARDFAARMFQFFECHLKGKPEPAWMAKGVPYLDREKDKQELQKLYGTGGK